MLMLLRPLKFLKELIQLSIFHQVVAKEWFNFLMILIYSRNLKQEELIYQQNL